MNDDQLFLANAYLDGELTAEERALADADPEVMAEVERLRAVRAAVGDVDPPTPAARESAVAAAMEAFGAVHARDADPEPTSPAPVPIRSRPRTRRFLAVAAAVVALGLLGLVVVRAPSGSDDAATDVADDRLTEDLDRAEEPADDSDDVAAATESAVATAPAVVAEEPAGGDDMASADADEEFADEPADDAASEAEEAAEAPVAADDAAEEPADDGGSDTASDGAGLDRSDVTGFSPEMPIRTEDELATFGLELLARRAAGTLDATPNTRCPAPVLDAGWVEVDGELFEVLVAVDELQGTVSAIERDTCAIVFSTPIPD